MQHAENLGQTFSIFFADSNGTFLRASEKKDRKTIKWLPFQKYLYDLCQNVTQY